MKRHYSLLNGSSQSLLRCIATGQKYSLQNRFISISIAPGKFTSLANQQRSFRSSAISPQQKNYYKILGVPKDAQKSDIKKKYFELVAFFPLEI